MGGEDCHGLLVMLQWTHRLHFPHAATSLVYSTLPTLCCHPGIKEIKQDAAVACTMWVTSLRPFDCHNNDYITMFHLACQPPLEDSQPCASATDMDSGLCGILNACRQVIITHRHTDATDSPMFSLAPILLISDIQCVNRRNSNPNPLTISRSGCDAKMDHGQTVHRWPKLAEAIQDIIKLLTWTNDISPT